MAGSVAEASAATLREMNPLVHVAARRARDAGASSSPDATLLEGVDVAVLTGASAGPALAWDAACRAAGVAFYAAACHGSASHFFADLGEHTYTPTVRACWLWWCEASGTFQRILPRHVEAYSCSNARYAGSSLQEMVSSHACLRWLQAQCCCSMQVAPHGFVSMGLVCPLRCMTRAPVITASAFPLQTHATLLQPWCARCAAGQGVCRAVGGRSGGELVIPAAGGRTVPAMEGPAPAAHP